MAHHIKISQLTQRVESMNSAIKSHFKTTKIDLDPLIITVDYDIYDLIEERKK